MPKNSGPTNRNFGLNHINGKGDASRITDVKAYRENFDEIDWRPRVSLRHSPAIRTRMNGLKTLRELEEEHEWRMGL